RGLKFEPHCCCCIYYIHKDFIDNWTKIIGTGPTMLYFQLLSYCYGHKKHAWPSVGTLAKRM
ncbi:unnamed protein product, partial [marine sediment metagenome]